MTEAEWLATDDVGRMLAFLSGNDGPPSRTGWHDRTTDRKLRLFACAVCRQAWYGMPCPRRCYPTTAGYIAASRSFVNHEGLEYACDCEGGKVGGLADERSRRAVETVERHADGLATDGELAAACQYAGGVAGPSDDASWWAYVWAAAACPAQAIGRIECVPAAVQAALHRDVFGNPFRPVALEKCPRCDGDGKAHGSDRPFEWSGPGTYPGPCPVCKGFRYVRPPWLTPTAIALARTCYDERGGEECEKCRGYGKLHRCRVCRGLWPTRQSEGLCVGCLYKGERVKLGPPADCPDCGGAGRMVTTGHLDSVLLALLADALEEAGCCDAALLGHLRQPGRQRCPACGGRGMVRQQDPSGHGDTDTVLCARCNPDRETRIRGIRSPDCGWVVNGPHVRGCVAVDAVLGLS